MIYDQYLFKNRLTIMNKALDAYAMRQEVIAKNIANVASQDYVPQKVKFEECFHDAFANVESSSSDGTKLAIGNSDVSEITPEIVEESIPGQEQYFAGNSHVNIDKEMSELAQNQIRFRFAAHMVKRFFEGLNTAITGYKES